MKSPEQFDFLKEGDQKKFEELPETNKEKIISEIHNDANALKEKVESGEAKNYKEAEEIIAKEGLENTAISIKNLLESGNYDIHELELYFNEYDKYGHSIRGIKTGLLGINRTISSLNSNESLKTMSAFYESIKKSFKGYLQNPPHHKGDAEFKAKQTKAGDKLVSDWIRVFFDAQVNPNNVKEFINSPMEQYVSPNHIIQKMGEYNNIDPDIVKYLIDKYTTDISKINLLGKNGILNNLEANEKAAILSEVLDDLALEMKEEVEAGELIHTNPLRWSLEHIKEAAKQKIVLPDYKDKLQKIGQAVYSISSMWYSDASINVQRNKFEEISILVKKAGGEKDEGITGKGLEFAKSEYGNAQHVYLDGEIVGGFFHAEFSEKATNGEAVAWLESEIIDRDTIRGTQNRDSVYVWKKGWKKPKRILEDHAWSDEKYFRIFAPEVTQEGKIKITRIDKDKTVEEEFDIE
ncbi:hypothetical protein KJ756_02195 [Patescibacteria group bacterium]|nr:hypothetical protein [Patescibacteria group bacterium]